MKDSLPTLPGSPADSLTRGHCGLLYSLETTQQNTIKTLPAGEDGRAQTTMASCTQNSSLLFVRCPLPRPVRVHSGHRPGTEGNDLWAAAALHADRVSPGLRRIRVPCHCEAWLPVPFHTPSHGFLFVVWSPTLSFFR